MHTWVIEGADRATGADRVVTVDALTEHEARLEAKKYNILVSVVRLARGELGMADTPADVPASRKSNPAPASVVGAVPEYAEITSGAAWLTFFGVLLSLLGAVSLVGGIFIFVIAVARPNDVGPVFNAPLGLTMAISGLLNLGGAALLRMFASVGLAIRDMAQNSFR